MNKIGNILTGLILIMSVWFLVISIMLGASHRNWRQAAEKFNNEAKQYQRTAEDAKSKGGQKDLLLEAERVARARQLAQLESRLRIAVTDLGDRETKWRTEQALNADLLAKLESTNQRLAEQDKEVAELKEINRNQQTEVARNVSLVQNLTNQKYELENQLHDLKKLNADVSAALAQKTKVMKARGLTDTDPTDHLVPPVQGRVTKVGDDRQIVAIELGSDDGLRVGHELDVYRNNRYIGKIRITSTEFNLAYGRIIRDFMQDQIREGDHVTSRL